MRGFVDYSIEAVIKFDGSILENPEVCRKALEKLEKLVEKGRKVVVIPGGGPTDLTIEKLNENYNFKPEIHHKACALAQDQTGLMLAGTSTSGNSAACKDLSEVLHQIQWLLGLLG